MESSNAAITIGGKIKRADLDKLAQALEDDDAGVDWIDTPPADELVGYIEEQARTGERLRFCNNEQAWG